MFITVYRVTIHPMSTIGYGVGKDENRQTFQFVGDHRPMRDLGEVVAQTPSEDELPTVELDDWQLINHSELIQ